MTCSCGCTRFYYHTETLFAVTAITADGAATIDKEKPNKNSGVYCEKCGKEAKGVVVENAD